MEKQKLFSILLACLVALAFMACEDSIAVAGNGSGGEAGGGAGGGTGGNGAGTGGNGGIGNYADLDIFVLDVSHDTDWDYMIVGRDGSSIFINVDANNDIPTRMFIRADRNSDVGFTILFKENGMPDKMIAEDHIIYFGNFRGYQFDMAIIYPNNSVEYFFDIQTHTNWDSFNEISIQGRFVRRLLSVVNHAVGVASCAVTPFFPPAVKKCAAYVVQQAVNIVARPIVNSLTGNVANTFMYALDCAGDGFLAPLACLNAFSSAASTLSNIDLNFANPRVALINEAIRTIDDDRHIIIPGSVTGVTLNLNALNLPLGGTAALIATVQPFIAANRAVVWSSSNPGVATVNSNGMVTAIAAGSANITATTAEGNRTATSVVTVAAGDGNGGDGNDDDTIGTPFIVRTVSASPGHTATIRADGSLWTWGSNVSGQLGDGTTTHRHTPVQVQPGTTWLSVATGGGHAEATGGAPSFPRGPHGLTVAIKADRSLWIWGHNMWGQLGDGTTVNRSIPVQVQPGATWASVSAGGGHIAAIRTDGSLWAWGRNHHGQLGDGTTIDRDVPVRIGADNNWAYVSVGFFHTMAIRTDGSLWAWGENRFRQLGDGTQTNRHTPVQVSGMTWSSVSAASSHNVAIRTDGSLWAWGTNRFGELGDGTTTNRYIPIQVQPGTTWASVSAASSHTAAIRTDGSLWAWGDNWRGQLGDGTTIDRHAPVQIRSGTTWTSVSSSSHTAGIRGGTVWTWGDNSFGQLGDDTTTDRHTPAQVIMR